MELGDGCPDCLDLAEALRNHIKKNKEQEEEIKGLKFLLEGTKINLKDAKQQIDLQLSYISELKGRINED